MQKTFAPGHYFLLDDRALRVADVTADQITLFDDLTQECRTIPADTPAMPVGATAPGQPVTPMMATFLLRLALAEVGLIRNYPKPGGDLLGYVSGQQVLFGFNVSHTPDSAKHLHWVVTFQGTPHVAFRRDEDGDYVPSNPDTAFTKLRQAFAKLDMGAIAIRMVSWDPESREISYPIRTEIPTWIRFVAGRAA